VVVDPTPVPGVARKPDPGPGARLDGRLLLAARSIWLVTVFWTLVCLAIAVPARYAQLVETFRNLSPSQELVLRNLGVSRALHANLLFTVEYVVIAVFIGIGLVIFWKRTDDWVAMAASAGLITYIAWTAPPLDALAGAGPVWSLSGSLVQAIGHLLATLIFLVFPDGRLIPRWSRWLLLLLGAVTVVWVLFPGSIFDFSNPFSLSLAAFFPLMFWRAIGAGAQVYRYLRVATTLQQQQTKWVLSAMTVAVVAYLAFGFDRFLVPLIGESRTAGIVYDLVGVPLFLLCILVIPVAFAYAILRQRLWEIDILINRTLVYGVLTGGIVLVYFTAVVVFPSLFGEIIGYQSGVAVAISTLVSAALFQPVRRRVQAVVDRWFYRRKYDAERTLAAFSASLRDDIEINRLTARLVAVVGEVMEPAHVSLWLWTPRTKSAAPGRPRSAQVTEVRSLSRNGKEG
jgi:hypothetical protein